MIRNLFKKSLVICAVIAAVSVVTSLASFHPVSAATEFRGSCRDILGLTSWDCGVHIESEDDLKSNIWTIAANVATDATVIAAYLVLGYVIYGGYLYVFAAGDPSKVASGKKTLTHAFIGLAIVMCASVIMGGLRIALVGGSGDISKCATSTATTDCVAPDQMVINLIQWFVGIAGVAAAIFVVYGGIGYITSAGDPSKLQKAKNTITYALIGLAIVALAEIITAFVSNMIRTSIAHTNITTISKEVYEIKHH